MTASGLRERKKQKTREAIQREAMRLFQERGYDETTIEQIAEAAEISPSTFFNYFPTKEDVVLFDRYDPMMVSLLSSLPSNEKLSVVFRLAFDGLGPVLEKDHDIILARARLGLEVPELRARFWEEVERAQHLIGGIIAARAGRNPDDFDVRVLAMVLVTAAFEGMLEWVRRGGRGAMFELVNEALDVSGVWERLDALDRGSRGSSPAG